uniref:F-box associated domain-containing protein n=2 Tax=Aegilops tauschii subsp. strangulata TaxID=200361 RepID=A0A453D9F8_AEGTS
RIPDYTDVFMDMWFLTDSEEVPWSNRYTITMPYQDQGCRSPCEASRGHPLWEMDDGRILLWVSNDKTRAQLLQVYDPRTNTYTDGVEMSCHSLIGVYKGSLLAGLPWIRNYGFFRRIKRAFD